MIIRSTKLDAEKRLALQEEKQVLEAKLLEVYVYSFDRIGQILKRDCSPKLVTRLAELRAQVDR